MKLEYRIIEVPEGDKQDCNFCSLEFWSENNLSFATATHEMMALDERTGDPVDIAHICIECKKDLENDILPYCELCGRLKRNRNNITCVCEWMKKKSFKPISTETIIANSFSSRLENKIKQLEKELSTKDGEIATHLEALEVSKDWHEKQKQELLDEIEKLKKEVERLKAQSEQLTSHQTAQIEVKKWPWKNK